MPVLAHALCGTFLTGIHLQGHPWQRRSVTLRCGKAQAARGRASLGWTAPVWLAKIRRSRRKPRDTDAAHRTERIPADPAVKSIGTVSAVQVQTNRNSLFGREFDWRPSPACRPSCDDPQACGALRSGLALCVALGATRLTASTELLSSFTDSADSYNTRLSSDPSTQP